ncbi:hypothetical protein H6F77_00700 [Microcoleus sp. FACHB-831]|nr:hypothetical protein [Microcoleus sp. FACHB-831]
MEYNSYLQNCDDDDVISFSENLYKMGKFKSALASSKEKVANVIIESLAPYGIKDVDI